MRVAIASGKGGTGKTTLATGLATLLAGRGVAVGLIDADVEEPDCHLFVHPEIRHREPVTVPVPTVDDAACDLCGVCADACAFKAITVVGTTVLVFPELCHSCGACTLLCPRHAIREEGRQTGVVERGLATPGDGRSFELVTGIMNVGEAKAVPTTRAAVAAFSSDAPGVPAPEVVIVDAPPGTSCPVIESVRGADVVVLVTEPTPFGLHDLELAVEMVRALHLPFVVAVNRTGIGDDRVEEYCAREGIEIVLRVADDRRIAETYARGALPVLTVDGLDGLLADAWERIRTAAHAREVTP
jgi:MinD superfamily P-loop ATPase